MLMPIAIPATMRRAAGVVTVSEFSRDEIRRLYDIPESRIAVAPNAVDPVFRDPRPKDAPVDAPFFLTLGNVQPRKNLITLIRAYRELIARHPEIAERLVIVGQEFYAADAVLREAGELTRAGRIVFTGYISDDEILGLLQRATAFAYPSVYEGFGLPVIEALAVGVPTLVSDIPVMLEVAGDAALRLPPTDPHAWAEALTRLVTDDRFRDGLARGARERSQRFTPEASAAPVLESLTRAVGRPG
jgi:glycosyltransferase involved in cell wall biosynthesis